MDEGKLVRRLQGGSRLALEQAISHFTPYVSAVVLRTLAGRGSREDMEEVVSDVFVSLWAHAGGLDPQQGLRPWLGTVARNKATDWLRTHQEPPTLPQEAAGGTDEGPEEEAERREWACRLWDAVDAMAEPDRTLFLRYYYYGDKLKEVAWALNLTQAAAKQRLLRGRKALRATLSQGGDGR